MKKVVVRLDLHDDKQKQKALKKVSSLTGINSISMDMKEKKLTVVGDVDPVEVVCKLRKTWYTEIVSVGPAKEEKKDPGKKDEKDQIAELVKACRAYNPPQYYYVHGMEENPNACVIC